MSRNVRVFEADLSDTVTAAYRPLLVAKGLSGRGELRIVRRVRAAVKQALLDTLVRAYRDGSAPYRTGRSRRIMFSGIRVFGTTFASLRGHIIGPDYIRAHNEGAVIEPKRAKALAIPLPPAMRADGTPKLPGPRSWRNVQRTFIYKSRKTGQGYIAYKAQSGKLTLLYALVESAQLSKYEGFLDNSWNFEKFQIIETLGAAILFEMGRVDLLDLARVTYRGRRSGGRRRR